MRRGRSVPQLWSEPHVETGTGRELSAGLLPLMNWIVGYAPPEPAEPAGLTSTYP